MLTRHVFLGIGVSKGIGIGQCFLLRSEEKEPALSPGRTVSPKDETDRFESASKHVKRELGEIATSLAAVADKEAANIIEAQMLILDDQQFLENVRKGIQSDQLSAEDAVNRSVDYLRIKFSKLSSGYMREREEDIREVGGWLVDALKGRHEELEFLSRKVLKQGSRIVLVGARLGAATVAHFHKNSLAGIANEMGSVTSHLAIVARSLGIPAVLGSRGLASELNDGDLVIIDGDKGEIIVNPTKAELERYQRESKALAMEPVTYGPTETLDGHRVQVFANVGDLESLKEAEAKGAEGIGLFRTEFLYFDRDTEPSEDELLNVLRQCIKVMKDRTIVVRTLDIGGDKKPSYIHFSEEKNPALGLRGIRYSLRNRMQFKTQIAAILRASAKGDIWIMFPMVSTVSEIKEARGLVNEVRQELRKTKTPFNEKAKIGIMVETPAASLISGSLADEADFFSIGTNDLVQYTLAADRENESVGSVADPMEPSVLKLIKTTIDNAHARGHHVGMCGEMASDPLAIPILIGMGLDEFSVNPASIQLVRKTIKSLKHSETKAAVSDVLPMESAAETREYSRKRFPH